MGILDGIVEWIAEQVMNILDLITTSVLGALGCSMDTFLRYFPAVDGSVVHNDVSCNRKKQNLKYGTRRVRIHHTDQFDTDDQIKTNLEKIIVIRIGVQIRNILK